MVKLNKFIKDCRFKMNKHKKASQLSREIKLNKPVSMPNLPKIVKLNTNVIKPLKIYKDQYYSEIENEDDPRKLLTERLRKESEEFTIKRLEELRLEFGITDNIYISFYFNLKFISVSYSVLRQGER